MDLGVRSNRRLEKTTHGALEFVLWPTVSTAAKPRAVKGMERVAHIHVEELKLLNFRCTD
jgi:hypothetical protein